MLSVVMPNFNHAAFLPEALDALLGQRRAPDEIIVIDDASTDESISVIELYVSRYTSIRLIRKSERLGAIVNVNHGLEMVRGDLIFFASADDVTYPGLFEKGISLLEAHPGAAMFSARSDVINVEGRRTGRLAAPVPLDSPGFIPSSMAARLLLKDDGWFDGTTTIWRRDSLIAAGGFRPEFGSFADGYLYRLLSLKHGACYSPEVLAGWRRMEGGMAWSSAIDIEQAKKLADAVRRQMSKDQIFPRGYPERWQGRHIFGARRFSLIQARRQAKSAGVLPFLWALLREWVLSAWLFAVLRPNDLLAVLARRARLASGQSGKAAL